MVRPSSPPSAPPVTIRSIALGFGFCRDASYSSARYTYAGCKRGGAWSRPGGDVGTAAEGFAATFDACADICRTRGFAYFGLECPMAGGTHCQCQDGTDLGTMGSRDECSGAADLDLRHCSNTASLTHEGVEYYLGGPDRGSVYSTTSYQPRFPQNQWVSVQLTHAPSGDVSIYWDGELKEALLPAQRPRPGSRPGASASGRPGATTQRRCP